MIRYDITELRINVEGHGSILVRSEMRENPRGVWVRHDEAEKQPPVRFASAAELQGSAADLMQGPATVLLSRAVCALGIEKFGVVVPYVEIDGKRFYLVSLE